MYERIMIIVLLININFVLFKVNRHDELLKTHQHSQNDIMVCGGFDNLCDDTYVPIYDNNLRIIGFKKGE